MARINDVGGMQFFGPIDTTDDAEPFHADWEARLFGLNCALISAGVFNLDEFRDAVETMEPGAYLAASYYERWFYASRTLLERKKIIEPGVLDD
jgi:nitrile hydratase subunit beta